MNATIIIRQDTILKRQPVQSSKLQEGERQAVAAGTRIEVTEIRPAEANHTRLSLASPLKGFYTWYAFTPHIQLPDAPKSLAVPYYPQTDNKFEPSRTCNTSSCAMCAKFLGANISGDDAYYQILRKYGDTTDHDAQTAALASLGIHSEFRRNLSFEEVEGQIKKGKPVVIGILHRGTEEAPRGGHMIVVIGVTAAGDFVCHDPYGSLYDQYTGPVTNGKAVTYRRKTLQARWLVEGPNSGWGRIFS